MDEYDYRKIKTLDVFGQMNSDISSIFIREGSDIGQLEKHFGLNFLDNDSMKKNLARKGLTENQIDDIIKNLGSAYTLYMNNCKREKIKKSKNINEQKIIEKSNIRKTPSKPNIPNESLKDILFNVAIKTKKQEKVVFPSQNDTMTLDLMQYSFAPMENSKLQGYCVNKNFNQSNPLIACFSSRDCLELLIVDYPLFKDPIFSINPIFPASKTKIYFEKTDKNKSEFSFSQDDVIKSSDDKLDENEYVLREKIKKIEFKVKADKINAYSVKKELIPSILTKIILEGVNKMNSDSLGYQKKSYEEIMSSLRGEKIEKFKDFNPETFARQTLSFHISRRISSF